MNLKSEAKQLESGPEADVTALAAAIAGGCEFVVVPEVEFSRDDLVSEIKAGIAKGKKHAIVAITEHMCDVDELAH